MCKKPTEFPVARRTCDLSPSKLRTRSRLDSLNHHRNTHLFAAKVDFCTSDRLLKMHIPVRPRLLAVRMRDRLVGQEETKQERRQRVLHAEILGDEGPDCFLIRLVRRSRSLNLQGAAKVAQFVFRVPGDWLEIDGHLGERESSSFTTRDFVILFRNARECVVLMSGHEVLLYSLHYDGQVHILGQDRFEEDVFERGVIDIN